MSVRVGRATLVALIAASVALLAGGCSPGGEADVATIGSAAPPEVVSPDVAVEALVSCLTDKQVPARLDQVDGLAQLGWDEGHDVFAVGPDGQAWMIRDRSRDYDQPDTVADYERFSSEHLTDGGYQYGLEVDGIDYSDVFASCVETSGYAPVSGQINVTEELAAKQALAQITNDWLACARDNGYPDWADVQAGEADDWLTSPTAFIPLIMTTDQLRELLTACPNFDQAVAERIEDPTFDWDNDFAAQPAVDIEPPSPPTSGNETDNTAAEAEYYAHYQALIELLDAAEMEFYAQRAAEQETAQ